MATQFQNVIHPYFRYLRTKFRDGSPGSISRAMREAAKRFKSRKLDALMYQEWPIPFALCRDCKSVVECRAMYAHSKACKEGSFTSRKIQVGNLIDISGTFPNLSLIMYGVLRHALTCNSLLKLFMKMSLP